MGRYCSCSGAAACPVKTPPEMRKNSWIPSPQMFQKLTWPKTRRHLGHVVRFVRFIPATTATISSMEPFVCKTEKIHRDVGAVRTLTFQVGDYRWPDGREYRGTSDPKFAKLHLIRREFFEIVFFVRMPMTYWSCFFNYFYMLISSNSSECLSHIRVPSGNISVTKVERRLYARLWHVPILFSWRWQGAKSLQKVCRLMFSVFRLHLSLDFVRKMTLLPALHGLLDERQVCIWCRGAGRGQEWRWMVEVCWGPFSYVISILSLTINNQGFYFVQYLCAPFDKKQLAWRCVFVTRPKEPFCRNMVPNASGS